jgi:hypothetical protein
MNELEIAAWLTARVAECPSNDGCLCDLCETLSKAAVIALQREIKEQSNV